MKQQDAERRALELQLPAEAALAASLKEGEQAGYVLIIAVKGEGGNMMLSFGSSMDAESAVKAMRAMADDLERGAGSVRVN